MGNRSKKHLSQNEREKVYTKIKQTEIHKWYNIPTGTIDMYFYMITKNYSPFY